MYQMKLHIANAWMHASTCISKICSLTEAHGVNYVHTWLSFL